MDDDGSVIEHADAGCLSASLQIRELIGGLRRRGMPPDRAGYSRLMLRLALVTVGDPTRLTGGHLYQRRLAQYAPDADATIDVTPIPSRPLTAPRQAAGAGLPDAASHADILVVDSLAAASVAGLMGDIGIPVLGLVHQRPGGAARTERSFALDLRAYREMTAVVATGPALADELRSLGVENVEVVDPGHGPGAGDRRSARPP